jgi:hypothetical protein
LGDYVTNSWLKTVWKYCREHGMQLKDSLPELKLARDNDKFLMQAFVRKNYSSNQLRMLNTCRCFLKAVTLADICKADGRAITTEAYAGIPYSQTSNSYKWPRQPSSLKAEYWTFWKQALNACFLRDEDTRRLWMPLREWHSDPSTYWPWMYRAASKTLYKRDGTE